jgi:hypothetical protein
MIRLLCVHCLPVNRTFQNQAGARVRSFDFAKEAQQMAKFARCLFAKQLQTALTG